MNCLIFVIVGLVALMEHSYHSYHITIEIISEYS